MTVENGAANLSVPGNTDTEITSLSKIRTIRQAAAFFSKHDPETCLTETALRTLIRQGRIPSSRVGRKYLVDLDAVSRYFSDSKVRADFSNKISPTVWRIT